MGWQQGSSAGTGLWEESSTVSNKALFWCKCSSSEMTCTESLNFDASLGVKDICCHLLGALFFSINCLSFHSFLEHGNQVGNCGAQKGIKGMFNSMLSSPLLFNFCRSAGLFSKKQQLLVVISLKQNKVYWDGCCSSL